MTLTNAKFTGTVKMGNKLYKEGDVYSLTEEDANKLCAFYVKNACSQSKTCGSDKRKCKVGKKKKNKKCKTC